MRWDALFADLEAQLTAADAAELAGEVTDRSRREVARLRLEDRARVAAGARVTVGLGAAGTTTGRLVRSAAEWWLLAEAPGGDQLVVTAAVTWMSGLPALSGDPEQVGTVDSRLGLGYALRGIARDRATVTLVLRDGVTVTGTIDGVGADFVDVAEHAPGEARRPGAVRGARTLPYRSLAVVRMTT